MTARRVELALVAVVAVVAAFGFKYCGKGEVKLAAAALEALGSSTSPASSASQASSSASTSSRAEAAEAAKVRTTAIDQAPTLVRDRSSTTFYRPDGAIDHVTVRDREVRRGARRETTEAAEASSSSSTASEASTRSSSSSVTTSEIAAPATWALVYGVKLLPDRKPLGLVGLERRLLGPIWITAWAAPGPLELGAGVRLQLGRVSIAYAPQLLPLPQLAGLVGVGFHVGGPFDLEAWAIPLSSTPRAGAALRIAW